MARLIHRGGAAVNVPDDKVSRLLRSGFTQAEQPKKTRSTKKADDTTEE